MVKSAAEYWEKRTAPDWAQYGRSLGHGIRNTGPFLPLGIAGEMLNRGTTDAIGVIGRFGSGLIKGAAGTGFLHQSTVSGADAFKGGIFFGKTGLTGGAVANSMHWAGQVIGGAIHQGVGNWGSVIGTSIKGSGRVIDDVSKWTGKAFFTGAGATDYNQLFGNKLRMGWSWLGHGAPLAIGAGKGLFGYWDKFAQSKAVNGPMDTEGVDLAPGAVNPSYSPLLPRVAKNKTPDTMGANADIVFATHAARNTGWLGR